VNKTRDIQHAYTALSQKLATIYDTAEAENIADWVIESMSGKNRQERSLAQDTLLTDAQEEQLEKYTAELLQHRPVQYVLGESYFYNLKLFVDENVLIPRPETEELVHWIIKSVGKTSDKQKIVDIGTGSGCIALSLKMELPDVQVFGLDISEEALRVANINGKALGLAVHFEQLDILKAEEGNHLPEFDIIVSNPPYITLPEKESILPNVLQYEPHQALFVSNNDPLQFYKAIEQFAQRKLAQHGSVFLELHRDFAVATEQYFMGRGWFTELRKDMQENDRMLRCSKIKF